MKPVVVHLRASNFLGGPERQLLGHALAARGAWYETVLTSFSEGRAGVDFLEAAAQAGLRTLLLKSSGPFDPAPLRQLLRVVQREPVALLVAHGYKAAAVCELVANISGRPWVGAARGFTGENRRVRGYESLELSLLKRAERVVAVSQGTAAMLRERGVASDRIRTIPNSVDVGAWKKRGAGGEYWLFSGRLSPEKNLSAALRALAALPGGTRLLVAGDGPLRAVLEQEASLLGIADRVEFLGFRKDVGELYAGALGLCLPSLKEGLPNAVLEALSSGLPVVASRVGGVPELIRDGETGLLVEPGDVPALAKAMGRIEQDPEGSAQMGLRGRELVREKFGFERQCRLWSAVYEEVYRSHARTAVAMRDRIRAGWTGGVGAVIGSRSALPVVLGFQRVADLEDPLETSARAPWVSRRSFEQLLELLERDFDVTPLASLANAPPWDRPRAALTFDGGWLDASDAALPLLRGREWAATLFVDASAEGEADPDAWQDRLWLGSLEAYRRGEPWHNIWRGVWPAEPARGRAELAAQCRVVVKRMSRWDASRRMEALATLPEAADFSGRTRKLGPGEWQALFAGPMEPGLELPAAWSHAPFDEAAITAGLAERASRVHLWTGSAPRALLLPEGPRTAAIAGLAREAGHTLVIGRLEGRVDPESPELVWPRLMVTEALLAGTDGRFSQDRFRFALARLR